MALLHWKWPHKEPRDVEVIEWSAEEWEAARQRALAGVGLTYEELEAQAKRRRFSSLQARKVWLLVREY
jgi:hypothetical protein